MGGGLGWTFLRKSSRKPETPVREKQALHNKPGSLRGKELPVDWDGGKVGPEHRASLGYLSALRTSS